MSATMAPKATAGRSTRLPCRPRSTPARGDRGGVVLIPAGDFVVGTVELKSNVTLRVAAAGRLVGSGKPDDFSAGKGVPPGNGNVVMLYAVDAENVTIEGPGTIDGQGQLFYTGKGDNTGPGGNSRRGISRAPASGDLLSLPQSAGAGHLPDAQRLPLRSHSGVPVREAGRRADSQSGQPEQRRLPSQQQSVRQHRQLQHPVPGRCVRAVREQPVRHGDELQFQHALVDLPLRQRGEREHRDFQLRDLRHLRVRDQDPRGGRRATGERVVLEPGDAQRHRADLDRAGFELPAARQCGAASQGRRSAT